MLGSSRPALVAAMAAAALPFAFDVHGDDARATPASAGAITVATAPRVELLRTLTGHTDWARCVAFRPDGALLASGGKDGMIRLWDPQTGAAEVLPSGHEC